MQHRMEIVNHMMADTDTETDSDTETGNDTDNDNDNGTLCRPTSPTELATFRSPFPCSSPFLYIVVSLPLARHTNVA